MKRIAIIGPTGVGKTTTSALVAKRLGVPLVSLDETRRIFLRETGYDENYSNDLKRRDFEAVIRYWEEFNPHVVRRTLESNPAGVFDFGAIHSVYDDSAKLEQVANWLSPMDDVVLLLPCADQQRSLEILLDRGREPGTSEATAAMWRRIIGRFISHGSNSRLSRRVIYTEGRTPAEVCGKILKTMKTKAKATSTNGRKFRLKTLAQAHAFVLAVGRCTIFADKKTPGPNLWDAVDLPDKKPGEKGWGQKIGAVWSWKNQLPAVYPDEIFYGKDERGRAVLMTLEHLAKEHYPKFHRPIEQCSPMARKIYALVKVEPMITPALRNALAQKDKALRAAFAKAMIELQVTLNIVRSNAPEAESDIWLRFSELYPAIAAS